MPDAPDRVVLSGYYGFGNLGDDALFEVLCGELLAAGCSEVLVPVGDPVRVPPIDGVTLLTRYDWRALDRAFRDGAALLSGGGTLLQDRTSFASLGYYLAVMQLAMRRKRPVAVAFQTIGPLERRISQRLASRYVRRASIVTVRDVASAETALALGADEGRLFISRDPAFVLPPPDPLPEPQDTIALCLRPTLAVEHVADIVTDWAALRPAGSRLRFVPFSPVDEALGHRLGARLPDLTVVRRPNTVRGVLSELAACRLVVAERLHAGIFAVLLGRRCVTLSYDPKVDGLTTDFGLPSAGSDCSVEVAGLAAAVDRTWAGDAEPGRLGGLAEATAHQVRADLRTVFAALA